MPYNIYFSSADVGVTAVVDEQFRASWSFNFVGQMWNFWMYEWEDANERGRVCGLLDPKASQRHVLHRIISDVVRHIGQIFSTHQSGTLYYASWYLSTSQKGADNYKEYIQWLACDRIIYCGFLANTSKVVHFS